jgi:hypothetical protein
MLDCGVPAREEISPSILIVNTGATYGLIGGNLPRQLFLFALAKFSYHRASFSSFDDTPDVLR